MNVFLQYVEIDNEAWYEDESFVKILGGFFHDFEPLEMVQFTEIVEHQKSFREEVKLQDRAYFKIYLRVDSFSTVYQVEPYGILTFFEDLGGLYSIIFGFFSVLVSM